ncbi:MAG: TIGR03663 family protein [Chloroflexota bacterium]|nr:TIGR03663 family protein [Chloroflexota bacterium]
MSSRNEALSAAGTMPLSSEMDRANVNPLAVPVSFVRTLTVESVLWLGLLVLAALTRFWDIGAKALHHDESLHAYYSWIWAAGVGDYTHDPLMHGPLLFHLNALVYLIFGASDATSRYAPAFTGIIIVGLPWLLRGPRFLGRWGALASGFLLLISPSIMYQSRYIRHDVYTVAGVLLMFICLVRYVENHERKWLITLLATTALMLANHEIIFALVLIFAGYMYGAIMLDRARAWWGSARDLVYAVIGLHVFAVLSLAALVLLLPSKYMDEFINPPWDNPTRQEQIDYYRSLLNNWLIIGIVLVGAVFVVGLAYLLRSYRRISPDGDGWLESAEERTPAGALRAAVADQTGLLVAGAVFLLLFVGLFTTLFTNWYGVFSSTISTEGTILYWLGQHDVQRGSQPWFYFMLLLPQYEFLPITIGLGLALLTCWRALRGLISGVVTDDRLFFRLFLTVWFFGIFAVLSWAGEKMPWLIVHIALPGTILAGAAVGRLIERGIALAEERRFTWLDLSVFAGLMVAAIGWFFLAARMTYGRMDGACPNGQNNCRRVLDGDLSNWWVLAIAPAAWLVLLGILGMRNGWRQSILVGGAAVVVVLSLLTMRVAWRLSFDNPDVPTEMMVYTQTSTEVKRGVLEANQLSRELAGEGDGLILFDTGPDGLSWPMYWYLREPTNARPFSGTIPNSNAAVIFILSSRVNQPENAQILQNYTGVDYAFRWHFPEELYRQFAIAPELEPWRSAWQDPANPHGPVDVIRSAAESTAVIFEADGQQELFRLVVYRDLDDVLGYYEFKMYVRTDLLPEFNEIRY